ncbi:hypothetical protein [Streptomyces flavidovirens]|uniref:hypothetical protein n=1 Tax=Streptomyces flavidovirens TaxID=67298 RepID=UPI0003FAD888|nr:hypothetical protein [Streptomyces flavidovirens]
MTRLLLAALTTASTATAVWLAVHGQIWAALLSAGFALALAETARAHRIAVRRTERLARPAGPGATTSPLFVPCCPFWTASAGEIHAANCPTWSDR